MRDPRSRKECTRQAPEDINGHHYHSIRTCLHRPRREFQAKRHGRFTVHQQVHRSSHEMEAVYPIRSKDEAIDTLSYFFQDHAIPLGMRIQRLRCDKGGEYTAGYFREFCKQTDREHEFAATNTSQQNGMSERDGRTIMNMVRCRLR